MRHRLKSLVYHFGIRLHLLTHIIILVLQGQLQHPFPVFHAQQLHRLLQIRLLLLELLAGMVPDDIVAGSLLHFPLHGNQVIESLVPFRVFRTLAGRQHGVQLRNHLQRVNHLVLGVSRMDILPLHLYLRAGGIKILILQLPFETAVHGIGELRPEALHIEEIHATPDLLVRCETQAHRSVFQFRMSHHILGSRHDFRHPRLVIGTQQRRPVGRNQRMPLIKRQLREIRHPHHQRIIQTDVFTIVILNHLRLHIRAAHIGTGIHMGDKPDHRASLISRRGRNRTHRIPIGIHLHILQPEPFHLLCQMVQQHQFLCRRRISLALRVALRVETDIFQKTFFQFHIFLFS